MLAASVFDYEPRHQNKRTKPITSPTTTSETPFKISELTSEQISQMLLTASSNTAIEFPEYPREGNRVFQLGKLEGADSISNQFQFKGFDIRTRPTTEDEFMGSFMHVQEDSGNPFDMNVRIPSLHEYSAFSNILAMSRSGKKPEIGRTQQKNSLQRREQAEAIASRLRSELMESKAKSELRKRVLEQEDSIFVNLQPLLNYQPPERMCIPMWEEEGEEMPEQANDPNLSKLIYHELVEQAAQQYELSNSYFFEPKQTAITERTLIDHLCKVLQGIETPLFRLDYQQLRWTPVEMFNARVQHYFKDSLPSHVESVLQAASYRSQIETALNFLKRSEFGRKFIYSEISNVYRECMLTFQAIVNECLDNSITFMEFELEVRRVGVELKLLKRFLLKDPPPRGYDDFNETFIHSEKDLFYMAYNRLKLNDYSQQEQKPLVARLTFGGLKCILYSLNVRLHHSRMEWQQLFYQEYYFTLFFERRREMIDKLSDRLNILHNEDYEVYAVCREKKRIELKTTYAQLILYEKEWNKLAEQKKYAIKAIEQRVIESRQRKHDEIYEQKANEIIEMKLKLAQRLQNDSRLRVEQKQKQRDYITKLQVEIKRKQEEQRLNKLIEIEREKGFLLDSELNEKRKLINEKYQLLASYPEAIQTFKTSTQIQGFQLKKAHSETQGLGEGVVIEQQQPGLRRPVSVEKMEEQQEQFKDPSSTGLIGMIEQEPLKSPAPEQVSNDLAPSQPAIPNGRLAIESALIKMEEDEDLPVISSEVPLGTAIEVCVNQVISNQLSVVNLAMASLLYSKHNIRSIFEFMRNFFLSSKGHYIGDLMDVAVCPASYFKLAYLKDSYFADIDEDILALKPTFYRVSQDLNQKSTDLYGEVNLIQQNLEMRVGFDLKALPDILKSYFNYIHLVKYMEIFSFVLRLRHCVRLTEMQWKGLGNYQRTLVRNCQPRSSEQWDMLKKLHHIRYIIQTCLNRLQNYLFFHVIEEEYGKLDAYLKARQFQQLPDKHLHFLDRVIIRGFINNPQRNISSRLRMLFADVRQFHNYVTLFCLDDIPVYSRPDTNDKINQVKLKCKQFSTILEHLMGDR